MTYFHEAESIAMTAGDSIPDVLTAVAQRYIGENPPQPYIYRAFNRGGFMRMKDYLYDMDLSVKAADTLPGQYVYVWGKLWSARDTSLTMSIRCLSPAVVYINGEEVFVSGLPEELFPLRRTNFAAAIKHGWNDVVLRFEKTVAGCGGSFGTGSYKNFPLHFITASAERDGQEGWLYSEPVNAPLAQLPVSGMSEAQTGLQWFPRRDWSDEDNIRGSWGRIFGIEAGM